jgi:hypothetical protein
VKIEEYSRKSWANLFAIVRIAFVRRATKQLLKAFVKIVIEFHICLSVIYAHYQINA